MPRFPGSGPVRLWLAFSLALAAMGCVNLEPVREFANISTQAVAYSELVDQYIEVPKASVRYIKANPSVSDILARRFEDKVAEREAQRAPLLALHAALADYMAAIGTLASDNLVKADAEFKALRKGVTALATSADLSPDTKSTLGAASSLLQLVADAALRGYQQKEVVDIMTNADPYVVAIIQHMTTLTRAAQVDLKAQRIQIESLFDTFPGGPDADAPDTPETRALAFLAAEERRVRLDALDQLGRKTERYAKLLEGIASAHHAFVKNPTRLSKKELIGELRSRSDELKALFEAVKQPLIELLPEKLKEVTS